MSRGRITRRSNSTTRGRNLTVRKMTEEELKQYGLPSTPQEAIQHEMATINEERTFRTLGDEDYRPTWELETTPQRQELKPKKEGYSVGVDDTVADSPRTREIYDEALYADCTE